MSGPGCEGITGTQGSTGPINAAIEAALDRVRDPVQRLDTVLANAKWAVGAGREPWTQRHQQNVDASVRLLVREILREVDRLPNGAPPGSEALARALADDARQPITQRLGLPKP